MPFAQSLRYEMTSRRLFGTMEYQAVKMQELSRMIIENYCWTQSSAKSRRLQRLVELSYAPSAEASDADAFFLEKLIGSEKNPEMKEAQEDLNDFLFNYLKFGKEPDKDYGRNNRKYSGWNYFPL